MTLTAFTVASMPSAVSGPFALSADIRLPLGIRDKLGEIEQFAGDVGCQCLAIERGIAVYLANVGFQARLERFIFVGTVPAT